MSVKSICGVNIVRSPQFCEDMQELSQESCEMLHYVNQIQFRLISIAENIGGKGEAFFLKTAIIGGILKKCENTERKEYYLSEPSSKVYARIAILSNCVLALRLQKKTQPAMASA